METPLGTVGLRVAVGDQALGDWVALSAGCDIELHCARNEAVVVECLRRPLAGEPVLGATLEGWWAFVCRVQPQRALTGLRIGAFWWPGYRWTEGGVETGEGLEAQTWSDGRTVVSVGTQDGEYLAERAKTEDRMPARIHSSLARDAFDLVAYTDTSLSIALPALEAGELCQIHFIVAWKASSPDDESTWDAVDLSPAKVLEGLD